MDDDTLLRYSRQIMLPEIDAGGQEKLAASRVLIIGLGGLGSPVCMYLAAAGIGCLALSDDDDVDLSNLQRQVVHGTENIGQAKVASAAATIASLNPLVRVIQLPCKLNDTELQQQLKAADLVVDCTDNFAARFTLNAACLQMQKPWVSAAAIRLEGQLTVFDPRDSTSPCYRCIYNDDDAAESCSDTGILGPVVGAIGTLQATEAIKMLLRIGTPLVGKLLSLDARTMEWLTVRVARQMHCPACGDGGDAR